MKTMPQQKKIRGHHYAMAWHGVALNLPPVTACNIKYRTPDFKFLSAFIFE